MTIPRFESLEAVGASNSNSPLDSHSDSTLDVLQQDPNDPLATDDSDADLWLD